MNNTTSIQVSTSLSNWGHALKVARKRRGWSQQHFASRLGTSISTVKRLEEGHTGVGIGVFANALWLLGMLDQVETAFDIYHDKLGISTEVERMNLKRDSRDDF